MTHSAETEKPVNTAAASTVLVTGAGSGIGLATVEVLLRSGRCVLAWDLAIGAIEARSACSAGRLHTTIVDVSEPDAVTAALQRAEAGGYPPAAVICCAGPPSANKMSFEAGLVAVVNCVRIPVERWLQTPAAENGVIVSVASIAGNLIGGEGDAWYSAGKAAVAGYTRHVARHRPRGIRANAVAPGLVSTPRVADFLDTPSIRRSLERNPMGRPASAEEVAAVLGFLVSPAASYLNGVILPVDGGLTVV